MRWRLLVLALALGGCAEADEGDSCVPEECTTPPPSLCETDTRGLPTDILITYSAQGTCVEDRCAYEATTASCPDECVPELGPEGEPIGAACSIRPPG